MSRQSLNVYMIRYLLIDVLLNILSKISWVPELGDGNSKPGHNTSNINAQASTVIELSCAIRLEFV